MVAPLRSAGGRHFQAGLRRRRPEARLRLRRGTRVRVLHPRVGGHRHLQARCWRHLEAGLRRSVGRLPTRAHVRRRLGTRRGRDVQASRGGRLPAARGQTEAGDRGGHEHGAPSQDRGAIQLGVAVGRPVRGGLSIFTHGRQGEHPGVQAQRVGAGRARVDSATVPPCTASSFAISSPGSPPRPRTTWASVPCAR